jgi:hypothetical protein
MNAKEGSGVFRNQRPVFIYEVRPSLLDRLPGRAFYFAASLGCAFSGDWSALVVTAERENMDHRVEAAAERLAVYARRRSLRYLNRSPQSSKRCYFVRMSLRLRLSH